jgi:transcriptional accessory protein Tex/SPT6
MKSVFAQDSIAPMIHAEQITFQLNVRPFQVTAVINLLDDGNTVPCIARFRKEMTGSLDDEQIRIITDELIHRLAVDGAVQLSWHLLVNKGSSQ